MFSHKCGNLIIDDDYYVIPFGHRCSSALASKFANLRKFSLPFDWTNRLYPNKIQRILANDFDEFIPIDIKINNNFINKYDVCLAHFNKNIEAGIDEYQRRIARFSSILKDKKKIYFVYINEDYLYDATFRHPDFNNRIFKEMCELESYLIENMKISFNILYFDFVEHLLPANSNIFQITLESPTYYNYFKDAPYNEFRNYCGKILSKMFNTTLNLGYSTEDFLG